jgi:hypothetical protein
MKTLRPKEGSEALKTPGENLSSSLAVFYVEQVTLNRHVLLVC